MTLETVPLVELASRRDVGPLYRLRQELEAWLHTKGIDQWRPGSLDEEEIADQVVRREWYLVRSPEGGVIAALRLLRADSEFWADDGIPAVYIHGLMVSRHVAGQGLGAALLEWVCDQGRSTQAQVIRLDCGESNIPLRAYYRAKGFEEVGRREFDRFAVTLFEKPTRRD